MVSLLAEQKRMAYAGTFVRVGSVFLILGLLSIIFESVKLAYRNSYFSESPEYFTPKLAPGMWCGAVFLLSGSLTIVAGKKLTTWLVVNALIQAVTTFIFGTALLAIEIIASTNLTRHQSTNTSSLVSLHAMLGVIAILAIIAAVTELIVFFRASFASHSTAVPLRGFNSTYSQTEVTRDDRTHQSTLAANCHQMKITFHKKSEGPEAGSKQKDLADVKAQGPEIKTNLSAPASEETNPIDYV